MNEKTKTLIFVGVALASTALAFATRPGSIRVDAIDDVGEALFDEFTDTAKAKSMRIVRFDESLASLSEIEIKESDGLWTLPSHDGYPADAENRIRDAATLFVDLKSMSVASDQDGDHALYGVLEPSVDESAVGDRGVGTSVSIRGEGGAKLVDLIIGKEVKDTEGQRYVRRPGQSRVYIAKVDPDVLPVRFEDWIEKDLLQVNGFDVSHMTLKDYSFQVAQTLRGAVTDYDLRSQITVRDDNGTWNLEEIMIGDGDELVPSQLGEDEQLSQDKLRDLKTALDELEIVSVERKPAKLGADLRADKGFANDQAGINSLLDRGFYPVTMPDGNLEVLSADGEVQLRTKDGVEYLLRFGGVEGVDTDSDEGALNRYLLVTARVNESMFPDPDLEDVPQTVEELQAMRAAEAEAASSAEIDDAPADVASEEPAAEEDSTRAQESAPDESTEDSADSDSTESDAGEAGAESDAPADENTGDTPVSDEAVEIDDPSAEGADEAAVETAEGSEQANAESETATLLVQETDNNNSDADSDSTETANDGSTESAASDETSELEAELKTEQERITRENQRKIDERNENLDKARQKVAELNYRFADWYYVISEEVYQKIHLGREDVVEPVEEDEASDAGDAASTNAGPGFPQ